jgi:hypothetical protein
MQLRLKITCDYLRCINDAVPRGISVQQERCAICHVFAQKRGQHLTNLSFGKRREIVALGRPVLVGGAEGDCP